MGVVGGIVGASIGVLVVVVVSAVQSLEPRIGSGGPSARTCGRRCDRPAVGSLSSISRCEAGTGGSVLTLC